MNLFKRDDYFAVLLFNCTEHENSELTCELGYWNHPQEGITTMVDEHGKEYQVIGPQDSMRQNILHINPTYDLEVQ